MESWLVMLAVLVMTPTVFYALHRVFDWAEALLHKLQNKIQNQIRIYRSDKCE
jgi:hypothetical protein